MRQRVDRADAEQVSTSELAAEPRPWQRLAPFFELPGRVRWEQASVWVELRPFNDRQLTRDLTALCERVNGHALHLPDNRLLVLSVARPPTRTSDLRRRL